MELSIGDIIRLGVILLGFVAVWSMWRARDLRGSLWTAKMKGIWIIQMGWPLVAIQANIELFYRHVAPTFALFWVYCLLVGTIWIALKNDKYTVDQK